MTQVHQNAKQEIRTRIKSNTSSNSKHPSSHTTIVYWDHDNTPIPPEHSVEHMIRTVKQHICDKIGSQPIHFRVYTSRHALPPQQQEALFLNGIEHIHIPPDTSTSPSACPLRVSTDIALKLFELEQNKDSKSIALISNGDGYAYLLSRIHKQPPISHLLYLTFDQINPRLTHHVDFVIECALKPKTIPNSNSNTKNALTAVLIQMCNTMDADNTASKTEIPQVRKRRRDTGTDTYTTHSAPVPKRRRMQIRQELISIVFKKLGAPSTAHKIQFFTNVTVKQIRTHLQYVLMNSKELVSFKVQTKRGKQKPRNPKPVLEFKGKRLENKKLLSHYNIHDGDVLHWYAQIQIGICHKSAPQERQDVVTFTINNANTFTINDVLAKFKQKVHLSASQCKMHPDPSKEETRMMLFYQGKVLDKQKSVSHYGITTHGILQWDYVHVCLRSASDRKQSLAQSNGQSSMNPIWMPMQTMPDLEQGSDIDSDDAA
eukprot:299823_1